MRNNIIFDEYMVEISKTKTIDDRTIYFLKDYNNPGQTEIKDLEVINYLNNIKGKLSLDDYDYILDRLNVAPLKPFKRLLRRSNITGYKLSKLANIPQQTVSSWASGSNDIRSASFSNVKKVSMVLGISLEELWDVVNVNADNEDQI